MIFITLGNQDFQFTRLLREIEDLLISHKISEPVIAQIGHTQFESKVIETFQFLDQAEFLEYMNKARIIITHAGTGSIINGLKLGKKVIAAARLSKFQEHIDNHQLEILEAFSGKQMILGLKKDLSDLELKINQCSSFIPIPFFSNNKNFNKQLINLIDNL